MIRIDEADENFRLLLYSFDKSWSPLENWLKKIGLERLPYGIKLIDLITNNVLPYEQRIDLPDDFFTNWENFPEFPTTLKNSCSNISYLFSYNPLLCPYSLNKNDKEWFLSPFDRTVKNQEISFLIKYVVSGKEPILEQQKHPNGNRYCRTKIYFNYSIGYLLWQIYPSLISSYKLKSYENLDEQIGIINKNLHAILHFDKISIESELKRWEKYRSVFQYLSYYRNLYAIVYSSFNKESSQKREDTIKEGTLKLLDYLTLTPHDLEQYLLQLLTIYREWDNRNKGFYPIKEEAVRELQKDIYFIIECLYTKTGNAYEYYGKKFLSNAIVAQNWSNLKDALPFELQSDKYFFDKSILNYLKDYIQEIRDEVSFGQDQIKKCIDYLWREFPSFEYFVRSYKRLHDNFQSSNYVIDFESIDVVDQLIVNIIRSEALLLNFTTEGKDRIRNLKDILKNLNKQFSESTFISKAILYCLDKWENTQVDPPADPFEKLMVLKPKTKYQELGKKLLKYGLLRNYLAHNDYLDGKLLNREMIENLYPDYLISFSILITSLLVLHNKI